MLSATTVKKKVNHQKIIFADFSELDCHMKNGVVNFKELEMCRYMEHVKRREEKLARQKQRREQEQDNLQKIVLNG